MEEQSNSSACILGQDRYPTTLVLATHGFIKKVDKVPDNEIARAINIRKKYFESKK
jgi:hypothetical protein